LSEVSWQFGYLCQTISPPGHLFLSCGSSCFLL
jgi:hypothetical protein